MNLVNQIRCRALWLNVPTTLVILLLQRTPVAKVVSAVQQIVASAPLGSVLRSATVGAVSVGVHTIAGATQLSASSPSPLSATVGTSVSVAFAITGTTSEPERWFLSGSFPPGLSVGGQTSGEVLGGTIFLTGTPTTAGTYNIGLQAKDDPTGYLTPVYNYQVIVTDSAPVAPSITTHPQSQSVNVGANVMLTVAASGTPSPTFQWRKDGIDINGATSATLSLNGIQLGDAGIYTAVASNSAGSATSNGATLTVTEPPAPPAITSHPSSQSVTEGANVSFTVAASGNPAPTIQWRKDGVDINGATSATLNLNNVQLGDAGVYTAVATNSAGSATSNAATLTVSQAAVAPAITMQPPSHNIGAGGTVIFGVEATGVPSPTIKWQISTDGGSNWSDVADGANYSGAATAQLRLINATAAMNGYRFRAMASNSEGSTASASATLSVAASLGPRLVNVSTRAFAGSGGGTLIVGFVIAGNGEKTVVIRGVGPRLAGFGVPVVVEDPAITLYDGSQQVVASNNDWTSSFAANTGGFSFDPGSKDAALEVTLPPGAYTVHLQNPGALAEALVEIYDISKDAGTRLKNVSCRLSIATGETVIMGTFLEGGAQSLLARAVGPGLAPYLLESERPFVLPDPHLRFFNTSGTQLAENDDWSSALEPHFVSVGSFPLSTGSKDAAERLAVASGGYTVHTTPNGPGGIVLIELYESP